ncbi:MAG: hypothetical protein HQL87_14270 [Magnetococcales bacterium]|nr:hypothetical protein [Magnetococcales bacterium]
MAHCPSCQKKETPPWTLTFANVALLLLIVFVAFLSVSRTDQGRSVRLVASLQRAFGVNGIPLTYDASADHLLSPIEFAQKIALLHQLSPLIDKRKADVETTSEGFLIRIDLDTLFIPGTQTLRPEGKPPLQALANLLASMDNRVQVVGYADTDDAAPPGNTHVRGNPLALAASSRLHQKVKPEARSGADGAARPEASAESASFPESPVLSGDSSIAQAYVGVVVRFLTTEGNMAAERLQSKGLPNTTSSPKGDAKAGLAQDPRIEILIEREASPTAAHVPNDKAAGVKTGK